MGGKYERKKDFLGYIWWIWLGRVGRLGEVVRDVYPGNKLLKKGGGEEGYGTRIKIGRYMMYTNELIKNVTSMKAQNAE